MEIRPPPVFLTRIPRNSRVLAGTGKGLAGPPSPARFRRGGFSVAQNGNHCAAVAAGITGRITCDGCAAS